MFAVKQDPDGPWLCPTCLKPLDIAESGLMQPCIACSGPASAVAYATPTPRSGPGAELSAILKDWLGIEASPTCSCRAMAAKMDAMGEEWCEGPGMPEILAVMRAEHAKRRLLIPWSDMAASAMVRLACWRSRSKNPH